MQQLPSENLGINKVLNSPQLSPFVHSANLTALTLPTKSSMCKVVTNMKIIANRHCPQSSEHALSPAELPDTSVCSNPTSSIYGMC